MPKVSVVIPCYNHGDFLIETLDSLEAQTFTNFEIIIVNDGSTEESTITLLNSLKRTNTRVYHTVNLGVSAARNKGISEAAGDYILPLDADDLIMPRFLELTVNVLDSNPDVAIVYCERVLFGECDGISQLPDYDSRTLLIDNCIYPAALFRKADWAAVGGYSERMVHGWEDWEFWISLSELNRKVVKIPYPLFFYRVRNNSRDRSIHFYQKILLMLLIIMRHKLLYLRNLDLIVKRIFNLVYNRMKVQGH